MTSKEQEVAGMLDYMFDYMIEIVTALKEGKQVQYRNEDTRRVG